MKRTAFALSALLAGALLLPAGAAAEEGAASTAAQPKRMKINFSGRTARTAGPGALVSVKCTGSVSTSCDGTLRLTVGTESHEVPFSLANGEKRLLVVPLGSAEELLGRAGPVIALAVAETVQPTGAVLSSEHRLRLR
jgi:hypothetical protein